MTNMTDAGDSAMRPPDPDARSTRKDVEHLFGQCLLQFQAFELSMKAIVAERRHQRAGHDPTSSVGLMIDQIAASVTQLDPDAPFTYRKSSAVHLDRQLSERCDVRRDQT
ncbi:hypothetical protein [Pontitalea aquivivens]|uniref:hypothetical protein n=1 Tax=Pontitalea aquivivens TaxID=3388663 RepID=UPI0039709D88